MRYTHNHMRRRHMIANAVAATCARTCMCRLQVSTSHHSDFASPTTKQLSAISLLRHTTALYHTANHTQSLKTSTNKLPQQSVSMSPFTFTSIVVGVKEKLHLSKKCNKKVSSPTISSPIEGSFEHQESHMPAAAVPPDYHVSFRATGSDRIAC
jgi:hypothetical protein